LPKRRGKPVKQRISAEEELTPEQTDLSPEETRVIEELRKVDWGKLTVIKKGGAVVMITPAPDIKVNP